MPSQRSDGVTSEFAWDDFGRLDHTDTQRSSGGTVTERTAYVNDAAGTRLLRREVGNTVLYLAGMELREGPGTGAVLPVAVSVGSESTVVWRIYER